MDTLNDFLTFRVMMTPALMKVAWVIVATGAVIAGLAAFARGDVGQGALLAIAVPVGSRIVFELAIIMFAIHESLTDIRRGIVRLPPPAP